MSRRKQRYPFHIAGEGDATDCQKDGFKNVATQVEDAADTATSVSSAEDDTTSHVSEVNPRESEGCDNQMNCLIVRYGVEDDGIGEDVETDSETGAQELPQTSSLLNGHHPIEKMDIQPYYTIAKGTNNANLCAKNISCTNLIESHKPTNSVNGVNNNNSRCSHSSGISFTTSLTKSSIQNDFKYSQNDGNPVSASEKTRQSSELENQVLRTELENQKVLRTESPSFTCPVCQENFKSKRSFNSHILIHCQLVKGPNSQKRNASESSHSDSPSKKFADGCSTEETNNQSNYGIPPGSTWDSILPLDLSCKNQELVVHSISNNLSPFYKRGSGSSKNSSFSSPRNAASPEGISDSDQLMIQIPEQSVDHKNQSVLSDRGPMEDENENLVNEAREHEKAFFDSSQNEHFLSEDSTGLEPPPLLPIVSSGGITRKMKVCSDDGPPMVYSIKLYAEQIFVSRILGVNEETGDKIELYKCFLCNLSFPSISRLQAHLLMHKQLFVCRKCNISCDSRIQFSQHVQKEHVTKETASETSRLQTDVSVDTSNAENTVTVAALLSALHGNSFDRNGFGSDDESERQTRTVQQEEEEEEFKSEESFPASPSSEVQMEGMSENVETSATAGGRGEGDIFKMFSCRFCGKKFDRAFSCNRHERVHTGYKPCFCRICGRGFSEPRNLRHHVIRFHSDGSLRHLIKRDRRKKREEEANSQLAMEYSSTELFLTERGNKEVDHPLMSNLVISRQENINPCSNGNLVVTYSTLTNSRIDSAVANGRISTNFSHHDPANMAQSETLNTYTTNLTKIFAASLDNSSRSRKPDSISTQNESKETHAFLESALREKSVFQLGDHSEHTDQLEPGEIRLNLRTKVVNDGERGRRLVLADDSEDGSDHSPQFSSYAPRLNIVQEPVNRDTLMPITDDIGRTFYECPYCLKLFGSTSDLNRHLDFHEDLRPYDCKYCEYSARTNSQLKVHKMRHEGIKQFSCDVCNYNGVTQSDLNRHKKTQSHIARSQNVCSMCGLGFYSSSQKQIHIAKCHPEMEGASSLIQMSMGIPHSSVSNSISGFLNSSDIPSPCTDNIVDTSTDLANESSCINQKIEGNIEDVPLSPTVSVSTIPSPESNLKINISSETFSESISMAI